MPEWTFLMSGRQIPRRSHDGTHPYRLGRRRWVVYLYRAGNSVACKTGIMPPFHHHIRGQRDGITPLFLPASAVGAALALLHVALCMAQRSRRRHTEATPASPTTPQAPPCPEALSWPHPPAPLRGLCAGSRVAPSGPLRTTTPHGPHARTAAPGGHLAAFLPASGLCVSGLARAGQYSCQRSSQRWPLAPAVLHQLRGLFPGDPWHPVAREARGAREAGVGRGRIGGRLG